MPHIEINYVSETQTAVQLQEEALLDINVEFELVSKKEFMARFSELYPDSKLPSDMLWCQIVGDHPDDELNGRHPDCRFLTNYSCDVILENYYLFINGIDYQHLPAGFFFTKNPQGSGRRDVLHFSDFVAQNQVLLSPFAITVSDKGAVQTLKQTLQFSNETLHWYRFLISKATTAQYQFCTQEELDNTFILFSKLIISKGLEFYHADFSAFKEDINPIVLMSRLVTILKNKDLKESNRHAQWHNITTFPLNLSYQTIRVLTDHQHSKNPCGFLLAEMQPTDLISDDSFTGINTIKKYSNIDNINQFWRYIAFQPKSNSIEFYEQALAKLTTMTLTPVQYLRLLQMLAGGSCDFNHSLYSQFDESLELEKWREICDLIENVENSNLFIKALIVTQTPGTFKQDFINQMTRLVEAPNIIFFHSIAKHIVNKFKSLGSADLAKIAAGIHPLADLMQLSNKLDQVIRAFRENIYIGARFYFQKGEWQTLTIKTYIELQHRLHTSSIIAKELFSPIISAFTIKKFEEIEALNTSFLTDASKLELLKFSLIFFNDASLPLEPSDLDKLLIKINSESNITPMAMLDFMSEYFSKAFIENYFEDKKQKLQDATSGLTPEQITLLDHYDFSPTIKNKIVSIESVIVRKVPLTRVQDLNKINNFFHTLSEIIMPDDFIVFVERLLTIKEQFSHTDDLTRLLETIAQQKSLSLFNTVYLRNKITASQDDLLVNKMLAYMKNSHVLSAQNWLISPQKIQEALATLFLKSNKIDFSHEDYQQQAINLVQGIYDEVIIKQPHTQDYLLSSINFITVNEHESYLNKVNHLFICFKSLNRIFTVDDTENSAKNMALFYSITSHYHNKTDELLALSKALLSIENDPFSRFFFSLVSSLLDSGQSINGIFKLIALCHDDEAKLKILQGNCLTPPYPSVADAITWLSEDSFKENYQRFSLAPYSDRIAAHAFNNKLFPLQSKAFPYMSPKTFTTEVGNNFELLLTENKTKSVFSLQQEIKQYRRKEKLPANELQTLLCLTIELLARTAHQHNASNRNGLSSQELNTTQIMSVYAMLLHENPKVINQIDTGEGKSRVSMILAAVNAIQGKTVDFITSDIVLAQRDFFSYKQFFTAINIRTGLISLQTPKQLYQKGGVNFSDNAQLLLLRNRSDIDLSGYDYLDEDKDNRCVIIDEVDKIIHDKSKDSYNYANKSKKLAGYLWIYPLLVDFIELHQDAIPLENDKLNFASLLDAFQGYITLNDTNLMHQASVASLKALQPMQLTLWLQSAHTALSLKNKKDYVLTSADEDKLYAVRDHEGITRFSRKIIVLESGRPMDGSAFSDGVHQCLAALKNKECGAEEFIILPENEVQRSSYSSSFLASYASIYGLSGTTRADAPKFDSKINLDSYHYMTTPREKKLERNDKNIRPAKNQDQQLHYIKHEILEAINLNKSFLLICKNDQESTRINNALLADGELQSAIKSWQYVHSLSSSDEERQAIAKAGTPGFLTISSVGMFSRGVDISAEHLSVCASFIPSLEDEIQIKGRAGRFGKAGDYRMIIDINDESTPINAQNYNIENSIAKQQNSMAATAVLEEKVSLVYARFLEEVHQSFLKEYKDTPKSQQLKQLANWQDFLGEMQKDWELQRQTLINFANAENQIAFINVFEQFTVRCLAKLPCLKPQTASFDKNHTEQVFQSLIAHKGFFKTGRKRLKIQHQYDIADAGQARIYSSLFVKTRAVFSGERELFADYNAWTEGRGALFPDLQATLNGERPLFADLRATIARLFEQLKQWYYDNPIGEKPDCLEPIGLVNTGGLS